MLIIMQDPVSPGQCRAAQPVYYVPRNALAVWQDKFTLDQSLCATHPARGLAAAAVERFLHAGSRLRMALTSGRTAWGPLEGHFCSYHYTRSCSRPQSTLYDSNPSWLTWQCSGPSQLFVTTGAFRFVGVSIAFK